MKHLIILLSMLFLIACENRRSRDVDSDFLIVKKNVLKLVKVEKKTKIKVMIIDTGIDFSHPLLKPFNKNPQDEGQLNNEHGTQMAGIIAQRLIETFGNSISEKVEFISCRYHYPKINSDQSLKKEVECFERALKENVDIINYSGGGSGSFDNELEVLKKLDAKKIPLITAAGNNYRRTTNIFPCNYKLKSVHCVGNIDINGYRASTSNFSENVKFMALGENLKSSTFNNDYSLASGTSGATAQITSLFIAKMLSDNPQKLETLARTTMASRWIYKLDIQRRVASLPNQQ